MVESPRLFLASDCANLLEARRQHGADADQLLFEPGFLALEVLCQVVSGRPVSDQTALEYLDGPPDPRADEGFQLFRMADSVVRRFAALTAQEEGAAVVRWSKRLQEHGHVGHDSSALAAALARLTNFARRGERLGKAVFLTVLFH